MIMNTASVRVYSCIMGTGRTGFSNCSYAEFYSHVSSGLNCLNNLPGLGYVVKRCGNKLWKRMRNVTVVQGEECEEDWCCRPDCKFKEGASCVKDCCHNCRFRPSGYMCHGWKKMNVTLQSTAMGPQLSVQVILISRMEPLQVQVPLCQKGLPIQDYAVPKHFWG